MMKVFVVAAIFICQSIISFSQDTARVIPPVKIVGGDTLTVVDVQPIVIFPPTVIRTKKESVRYDRLVYNVKKVYPYAKLAGAKLREYEKVLDTIPTEKGKRLFLKKAQHSLEEQFGKEIKDLTFSQGKILIKLVYRETGNSTFDLIKELRGGFTAFIFQTLATIFGYNLKTGYDPAGTDQAIEQIVLMIEAGAI
ncbi:MAG: DUF4294 domain-containing protein [Alphaproteobacteria bacterium]|nr:DUF4294 domain-containing protein [Alphaproteobacteria bacterium]